MNEVHESIDVQRWYYDARCCEDTDLEHAVNRLKQQLMPGSIPHHAQRPQSQNNFAVAVALFKKNTFNAKPLRETLARILRPRVFFFLQIIASTDLG